MDELDKFTDAQTQIKAAKFLQSIVRTKLGEFKLKEISSDKVKRGTNTFIVDGKLDEGVSDTITAVCSQQCYKLPAVAYEKNNHRGPAIDKSDDGTKDPSAYIAQIEAGFSKTRITKVSSKKEFYKYTEQAPPKCFYKNPTVFIPIPPSDEQVLKNTRVEVAPNPKNKGTKSWHRYEAYKNATTLYEYLYAGGGGGNGDYKYDFFKCHLKILDPWWTSIPEPIQN